MLNGLRRRKNSASANATPNAGFAENASGEPLAQDLNVMSKAYVNPSADKRQTVTKEPELYEMLENFDWKVSGDATALEERLHNEMQALESANIHAFIQSADPAKELTGQIDRTLVELAAIDSWLSGYTGMLDMMGQDVQEIEAKNKDLQVVSENQKKLLEELSRLMDSLLLPAWITENLTSAPLDTTNGIAKCEDAAAALLKLVQQKFPTPLNDMGAVKERLALFTKHGADFSGKLCSFLHSKLQAQGELIQTSTLSAEPRRLKANESLTNSLEQLSNSSSCGHNMLRSVLTPYTQLIYLSKQFETRRHYELQMDYASTMNRIISKELQFFIENIKLLLWVKRPKESELTFHFSVALATGATQLSSALRTIVGSSSTNPNPNSAFSGSIAASEGSSSSAGSPGRPPGGRHQRQGSIYNSTIDTTEAYMSQVRGTNALINADRKIAYASTVCPVNSLFKCISTSAGVNTDSLLEANEKLGGDELFIFAIETLLPIVDEEREYLQNALKLVPVSSRDVKVYSRLKELLDTIFDTLPVELMQLVHKCSKTDPTLCISMAVRIEQLLEKHSVPSEGGRALLDAEPPEDSIDKSAANLAKTETGVSSGSTAYLKNSFVCALLEKCLNKVHGILDNFANEQIKAISDPALALRKRNGILIIVDTVPAFIDRVEFLLSGWDNGNMKEYVNKIYARIAHAVFDSLAKMSDSSELLVGGEQSTSREIGHKRGASTFIGSSKDAASHAGNSAVSWPTSADEGAPANATQQKLMLHWHVLMVQNMHFFSMSVRARKVKAFESWLKLARMLYEEHLKKYTQAVTRRPFNRLYEFFDGIEAHLASGSSHDEVSFHSQFSKSTAREVLSKFPSKDVRNALRALFKRVDKHFNDQDGLLQVVWHSVSEALLKDIRRFEELLAKCYPNSGLQLEFNTFHLSSFLSEMAQET